MKEFMIILRRLFQQKVFFGINLFGLTIGFVFALLAFLYAQNEICYDKHFTNTENTYLLACNNGRNREMHFGQPAVFMDKILENVPEVLEGVRLKWADENIKVNKERIKAIDFVYADSSFFSFFGWGLYVGNPSQVLRHPMSVVISEKMVAQLFKDEDPIGKLININNEYDLTVTGIFKDIPEQSHIKTDFIASISSWEQINKNFLVGWGWHSSGMYIKTNTFSEISKVEKKIADVWNQNSKDISCVGSHVQSELLPFKQIYLKAGKVIGGPSVIDFVMGFSIIAALILIISCFNFINLSIALNSKHAVENGLRKVLGAGSKFFIRQVLTEMTTYLALAFVLSCIIVIGILPTLNSHTEINLTFSLIHNPAILIFSFALILILITVCGSLPIFQKVKANISGLLKGNSLLLNNKSKVLGKHSFLRDTLVTSQFAIGIVLIVTALTVNNQLKFIRQHSTGFNKEQILVIDNYEGKQDEKFNVLSQTLKQYPEIVAITSGSNVPLSGVGNWGGAIEIGNEENGMEGCGFISVDYNYLELIGANFVQGRNFIKDRTSELDKIIINESMVKALNLDKPVGKELGELWEKRKEIIGVVEDIEFNTLHSKSIPIVFFCQRTDYLGYRDQIMIKLQSENLPNLISIITEHWNEVSPEYPIDYRFMDERFDSNYEAETLTSTILNVMTVVATFLSSIGLFGLALFHINARIKEIGIRKVNGAKVNEILYLINAEFVKRVAFAFVIASPIAWFTAYKWLENYAYKTTLSWWIFTLAGIMALGIALLTVSWQSWRVATRNPVEALRYE